MNFISSPWQIPQIESSPIAPVEHFLANQRLECKSIDLDWLPANRDFGSMNQVDSLFDHIRF